MARIRRHFKENGLFYLAAILITSFVLFPYFDDVIYRGHDLQYHLSRLDGIVTAIADRQFPLAIYPDKNFGYGYASPLFYSDLFLIIPSVLVKVFSIPLVIMFKIIVFVFTFITNLTMMMVLHLFFRRKDAAVFGAFLLTSCNYYVTDVYIRGALGEIMAFAFMPALLWVGYHYFVKEEDNWLPFGLVFAGIAHCHLISVVLAAGVFGLFMIADLSRLLKNRRMLVTFLKAFLLGAGLTIGYFLPMAEQYVAQDLRVHHIEATMLETYRVPVSMIWQDFISEFGMVWASEAGLNTADKLKTLGTIMLVLPIGYLFVKKQRYLTILFVFFVGLVFLSSSLSPLHKLSFLSFLQYPSRLYIIASVLGSVLSAYIVSRMKFSMASVLSALVLTYTFLNLSFVFTTVNDREHVMDIPDKTSAWDIFGDRLFAYDHWIFILWNWEEVAGGEYLPFAYEYRYVDTGDIIAYLDYSDTGFPYERKGTTAHFQTDLAQEEWLLLPTSWYKGYRVWEVDENDNIISQMYVSQHEYSGRIQLHIPAGHHRYLVRYIGTKIQKASASLSVLTAVFAFWCLIRKRGFGSDDFA
ncbi:MAG: hypothetical protein K6F23_10815 [Solobacterium sp.]|nr:hypothetical protein [Solobacterium sp.]